MTNTAVAELAPEQLPTTERIAGALALTDEALELAAVREKFTAEEIMNLLLDLRLTLAGPG